MEEASISVKRKGMLSDQRRTSRHEPKCTPHGATTRQSAVKAICTITIVIGWTAILSNSIYGLFAPRFMGFQQAELR